MLLSKLILVNFRNYENVVIHFNSKINFLIGLNAQGKTNILEAIYLLCLGRSFRFAKNQELLKINKSYFIIEGKIKKDNSLSKRVIIQYKKNGKKEISIDRKKVAKNSDFFGKFPIVALSPDDYKITTGSPSERRRFIDLLLSQVSISYLQNLQEYHKILKQRNKILQDFKGGRSYTVMAIEPWTQSLVRVGSLLMAERFRFISDFAIILSEVYKSFVDANDQLTLSLVPSFEVMQKKSIEDNFLDNLKKKETTERWMGSTVVGPHRDDLEFKINDQNLRKYGSRGEHKSVIIALKLAEYKFLKQKKAETPVFLLDDFGSELDDVRQQKIFLSFEGQGQMFFTSPNEQVLKFPGLDKYQPHDVSVFFIKDGLVEEHEKERT
ncbi:MAG: DNA replication/repair protein RecF [bacterium]